MRKLWKLLVYLAAGLAVIGFVVFSFVLFPAHWQIRSLAIDIPPAEAVDAALEAIDEENLPTEIFFVNTAQQSSPFGHLGHVGILISWRNGNTFLIDTGMSPAEAVAFGKPFEYLGAGPTAAYGSIEAQLGTAVEDIRGIGFTHLHTDHTAGIARLCSKMSSPAPIYQTPDQQQLHNLHTQDSQTLVNTSKCAKEMLGYDTIKAVPGFPGLFAIAAGGHTPGSTIYVTRVNTETWIFAGDITNAMADIQDNRGKGFAYSYLLIPEDTDLLERWRLWLKAQDDRDGVQVLVAHDIDAYQASELTQWRQ
mgnify:CR=1 FL=1